MLFRQLPVIVCPCRIEMTGVGWNLHPLIILAATAIVVDAVMTSAAGSRRKFALIVWVRRE